MFNSSESTARSTIEASCLETFPLRSTVLRLFDPSAVTDIQTEISQFVSGRQNRRVAADEIFDLNDLLALGGEILRISDGQILCNRLRECDSRSGIVFGAQQKRINADASCAEQTESIAHALLKQIEKN